MIIGSNLVFQKYTDSTNTYANWLLQSGHIPEGTIVYTNFQSAGRGQKGNKWTSEDGKNLLISVILYPEMIRPEEQFIISIFVSLAICDFLKMNSIACSIKWPNDIYAGDDKIAGILIENYIISDSIHHSIAGIGININQEKFPEEIPNPVSVKLLTGSDSDLDLCLKQLAGCLDRRYKQTFTGTFSEIRKEYISSLYRLEEWHRFDTGNGHLYGKITSVTGSGCLQIEDKDFNMHEFRFREIDFIR